MVCHRAALTIMAHYLIALCAYIHVVAKHCTVPRIFTYTIHAQHTERDAGETEGEGRERDTQDTSTKQRHSEAKAGSGRERYAYKHAAHHVPMSREFREVVFEDVGLMWGLLTLNN